MKRTAFILHPSSAIRRSCFGRRRERKGGREEGKEEEEKRGSPLAITKPEEPPCKHEICGTDTFVYCSREGVSVPEGCMNRRARRVPTRQAGSRIEGEKTVPIVPTVPHARFRCKGGERI